MLQPGTPNHQLQPIERLNFVFGVYSDYSMNNSFRRL